MRRWVWLLAMGCAPEALDEPLDTSANLGSCSAGGEQVVMVSSLRVARLVNDVADGFDLDGVVTQAGEGTGCGVVDLVDEAGTPGIDNAFANLVPALDRTEALALEPLVQTAINGGGMMLLVRWTGIDDAEDDDCVTVESLSGTGPVFVGPNDRLLPGQTIEVDPEATRSVSPVGSVEGGRVVAGPLEIVVGVEVLRANLDLPLRDARITLEPDGMGGWRGLVGGGIAVADMLAIANIDELDDAVGALMGAILPPMADLFPDENGQCSHISFAAEIDAVPVFLFDSEEEL